MSKDDEKRLELCECEAREPACRETGVYKTSGREQLLERSWDPFRTHAVGTMGTVISEELAAIRQGVSSEGRSEHSEQ